MNEQREKSAMRLYDAIGNIDDKLISDAQTPARVYAHRRARERFIALGIAAACIMLMVITPTAKLLYDTVNGTFAPSEDKTNDANDSENTAKTLYDILADASTKANVGHTSYDGINFFDNRAKLIWQNYGDDKYNVLNISSGTTLSTLTAQLSKSERMISYDTDADCKVWISYGDGKVVTPYLKQSTGNTGYAELFDYSPEVEPTDKFTSIVSSLIAEN